MDEIKITVEGPAGSGRTAIAHNLTEILRSRGFRITHASDSLSMKDKQAMEANYRKIAQSANITVEDRLPRRI